MREKKCPWTLSFCAGQPVSLWHHKQGLAYVAQVSVMCEPDDVDRPDITVPVDWA